jgi:hypothetical protein
LKSPCSLSLRADRESEELEDFSLERIKLLSSLASCLTRSIYRLSCS